MVCSHFLLRFFSMLFAKKIIFFSKSPNSKTWVIFSKQSFSWMRSALFRSFFSYPIFSLDFFSFQYFSSSEPNIHIFITRIDPIETSLWVLFLVVDFWHCDSNHFEINLFFVLPIPVEKDRKEIQENKQLLAERGGTKDKRKIWHLPA